MTLDSFLPNPLISFLGEVEDLGFSLCIVGGAVRDYLSQNITSHDLDFEIRAKNLISDEEWPLYYQKLIDLFEQKNLKITKHPYLITKINFLEWSLEFSSPRLEKFQAEDNLSHHNFTAHLSSNLNYMESFKRRDFTLNAIGFEISCKSNSMKIIDPYHGEIDLKEKKLVAIDDLFFKDSVRFLRLIRFSVKYDFSIDPTLLTNCHQFKLENLSKYHFTAEILKTDPGKFLHIFQSLVKKYALRLPNEFSFWIRDQVFLPVGLLETKEDILIWTFCHDQKLALEVKEFFSFSVKQWRELENYFSQNPRKNSELEQKVKKLGIKHG